MSQSIESRPWSAVRWVHRRLRFGTSLLLDRALGVRTSFVESTALFGTDDPLLRAEKPTGWLTLYRVFRALDITPEDVMVDFGSGSGRAVLVASLFPFQRVIGVERQERLYERAMDNLARFRPRRRASVVFVCSDARQYALPDDVTAVFFYNPFAGETFGQVMAGVFASVDRAPRRLRVAYVAPTEHAYLIATGRCRCVAKIGGLRPTPAWSKMLAAYIYDVEPLSGDNCTRLRSRPLTHQAVVPSNDGADLISQTAPPMPGLRRGHWTADFLAPLVA